MGGGGGGGGGGAKHKADTDKNRARVRVMYVAGVHINESCRCIMNTTHPSLHHS